VIPRGGKAPRFPRGLAGPRGPVYTRPTMQRRGPHFSPTRRGVLGTAAALGIALFGLLPVAPAAAQIDDEDALLDPEEAMEEARRAFRQGRRAYAREQYGQALASFRRAHRLTASPDLLFHIGAAADRLGQVEPALEAYREFVRLRPSAPERRTADQRIQLLEAALAEDPDRPSAPGGPEVGPGAPTTVDPDPEDGPTPDLRLPPPDAGAAEASERTTGPGAGPWVLLGAGVAATAGGTVALVLGTDDGASDALTPAGAVLVGIGAAAIAGGLTWAIVGGGEADDRSRDEDPSSPRDGATRPPGGSGTDASAARRRATLHLTPTWGGIVLHGRY